MRKYYNLRDNTETHVHILQNVEQEANVATEILHSSLAGHGRITSYEEQKCPKKEVQNFSKVANSKAIYASRCKCRTCIFWL
jgi:hypothetical protein